MNSHYENYLIKKYEPLYNRSGSFKNAFTAYGFCCGDGWFDIINTLSAQLCADWLVAKQKYNQLAQQLGKLKFPECDPAATWNPIVTEELVAAARADMDAAADKVPQVVQVKEKFGSLRFYATKCNDVQSAAIEFAEQLTLKTCEVCGARGKVMERGWIKVRCKTHQGEDV